MNKLARVFCLLPFLFMGSKCNDKANQKALEGDWICTQVEGVSNTKGEAAPIVHFHLNNKTASGKGGCNTWDATMETNGKGAVHFGPIKATKKACRPFETQVESAFFKALGEADHYVFTENGRLKLFNKQTELIEFKPLLIDFE